MLTYCTIHVNQIIVLYTLNLHSAVCQLHFNKTVKKIVTWLMKTQALLSLPSILLKHCCKVRKIYHKIFGYIFLKSSRIINSSNANIYHWSLLCLRRHAKDLMHIIVLIINHPLQTVLLLSPFYRWWLRLREITSLTQVHKALPQDQDSTTPKHIVLTLSYFTWELETTL